MTADQCHILEFFKCHWSFPNQLTCGIGEHVQSCPSLLFWGFLDIWDVEPLTRDLTVSVPPERELAGRWLNQFPVNVSLVHGFPLSLVWFITFMDKGQKVSGLSLAGFHLCFLQVIFCWLHQTGTFSVYWRSLQLDVKWLEWELKHHHLSAVWQHQLTGLKNSQASTLVS